MSRPFSYGSIPPGWTSTKLRTVMKRKKRLGRPDLPLLSVNLPIGVVIRPTDSGRQAPSEDLSGYQVVNQGDLVVNQLGKPHGALGVSKHSGIISPAYFVAEFNEKVEPHFMHHLLRTRLYISEYERRGKFMPPNQFDISWDEFRDIEIVLPPRSQQKKIADYLDRETTRIDALIEKKRRLLHLVDFRQQEFERQTIFQTGQPLIPLRWFMSIGSGMNLSNEDLVEDGCTLVVGGNGKIGLTNQKSMIEEKSVVVGRVGALCGNVHLVEPPTWITDNALLMTNLISLIPDYLAVVLRAMDINSLANKTAQPLITGETIKSLAVPMPDKQEQMDLVRELDMSRNRTQEKKRIIEAQIELFVERRTALITAAVTGEITIPEVAA